MAARYEYDLDLNGEWRWLAIADTGEMSAISPVGYPHLQDCMHAVGLMQDHGDLAVVPGIAQTQDIDPSENSLSRLQRRPSVTQRATPRQPHRADAAFRS